MSLRPDLLDSAAEVYAIALHYESEGDPELLRRVRVRFKRSGLIEDQVRERLEQRAAALRQEWATAPAARTEPGE